VTVEPPKNKKILVVEDDLDCIILLQDMFSSVAKGSHTLVSAQSLDTAFQLLRESSFDVILLDLNLPDSRGLDTLVKMRKRCPNELIVVITGCDDEDIRSRIISCGAQDYFVKGRQDDSILLRFIESGIDRHQLKRYLEMTQDELTANRDNLMRANKGMQQLASELDAKKKEVLEAVKRVESFALMDPLTNLPNRRGLQQVVSRELARLRRGEYYVSVFLVNLDDFKNVNRSFGLAVGDIVLKEIAQRIKRILRTTDNVAYLNSGEFMVVLPNIRIAESVEVAEKLRLMIAHKPIIISGGDMVSVTATISVTELRNESPTIDELLGELHPTLKRSKLSGGNRVALSLQGPEDPGEAKDALSIVIDQLKGGKLFYSVRHPIVSLADEAIVGYEILSRFTGSVFQGPDDFFRICIENDILTKVDRQCFQMCVADGKALSPEKWQHINVFPSTLIDMPAEQLISEFKAASGKNQYCIEISEQQIIGDPSYLLDAINVFKANGIKIAIDDVGFGQSCLESLVVLEPDILKIDKRRVIGIAKSKSLERQFERFTRIAKSLEIDVIAEGVETRDDFEIIRSLGVNYGQGFLWGLPM